MNDAYGVMVFGGARGMGLWVAELLQRHGCRPVSMSTSGNEQRFEMTKKPSSPGESIFKSAPWSPGGSATGSWYWVMEAQGQGHLTRVLAPSQSLQELLRPDTISQILERRRTKL